MYRGWISRKFRSQIWDGEIEGDRNWDGVYLGNLCCWSWTSWGPFSSFQPGWWFFVLVVEAQGRKLCYLMSIRENSRTMRIRRGPKRHLIHLVSRYFFYSKRHHVPPVLVMHCFYTLPPGCTVDFFLQGCRNATHVSLVALVQAFRFEDQLAITSFLLAGKPGLWFLKGPTVAKCRGETPGILGIFWLEKPKAKMPYIYPYGCFQK